MLLTMRTSCRFAVFHGENPCPRERGMPVFIDAKTIKMPAARMHTIRMILIINIMSGILYDIRVGVVSLTPPTNCDFKLDSLPFTLQDREGKSPAFSGKSKNTKNVVGSQGVLLKIKPSLKSDFLCGRARTYILSGVKPDPEGRPATG